MKTQICRFLVKNSSETIPPVTWQGFFFYFSMSLFKKNTYIDVVGIKNIEISSKSVNPIINWSTLLLIGCLNKQWIPNINFSGHCPNKQVP